MTLKFLDPYSPFILVIYLFLIHLLSTQSLTKIFLLLHRITGSKFISGWLLSILLLPGTLLHELFHLLTAKLLFLKITSFTIIPKKIDKGIKLGEVTFLSRDRLSALIVGASPIIGGICAVYLLSSVIIDNLAPGVIFFVILYLIFSISSTMFSSPEDLKDLAVTIPILIAAICIDVFLDIPVFGWILKNQEVVAITSILNNMLILTILMHLLLYIITSIIYKIYLTD